MLFEQFVEERNISKRTMKSYQTAIRKYELFNVMTIEDLIREADEEESQGIRWKDRKIKQRLIKFRKEVYNTNLSSSAQMYMQRVTTFYRHYEVELHPLPPMSRVNMCNSEPISFKDIPTKEILRKAIRESKSKVFSTIIYFMSSTGLAMVDTLDLTIKDFLVACDALSIDELDNCKNTIPTFTLKRRKTGKYFYTFATPEATSEVINYLKSRTDELTENSQLFKISRDYLCKQFQSMNKHLGLGTKNGSSLFRSHMLRKYHASTLLNSGLMIEQVDMLQGRSKEKTHESYFFDDPEVLKKLYMEHMDDLCIADESDEIIELKKINEEYEVKFSEQEKLLNDIVEAQEKLEKLFEL